jgi:hypothetical protein
VTAAKGSFQHNSASRFPANVNSWRNLTKAKHHCLLCVLQMNAMMNEAAQTRKMPWLLLWMTSK